MNKIRVDEMMTRLVVTLRPEDTIEHAARMLVRNGISGAPVVQEGKLAGLVSEGDLAPPARSRSPSVAIEPLTVLVQGRPRRRAHKVSVGDVMSRDVVSISMDASVWEAASLIDRHGFRRLPVIDGEGHVMGILTRSDLVRAMAPTDPDLVASVREAIGVLELKNFSGLDISSENGCVAIGGIADRKSTRDIAMHIASRVPGVLEISDELEWRWDDTDVTPVRALANSADLGAPPSGLRAR
jgi:CBS domain-containing protein